MDVVTGDPADRRLVETCARLMSRSEPWLTLQRSFESAVAALQDPGKELHVMQGADGALYGTAAVGGSYDAGTVFKLNPDGTGFTVLLNFD